MPAIWHREKEDHSIVVWQSTEPLNDLTKDLSLTSDEMNEFESFRSMTRKREWLTVRAALRSLLPDPKFSTIRYNENGKPLLIGDRSISISHSQEFVAVMISNIPRIGIDIEVPHPRIEKIIHKFLNESENKDVSDKDRLWKLHVMWGAKEVLYKIHSIGGIDFKKDLYVHPFTFSDSGELIASIKKKGHENEFKIFYESSEKYMLTWGLG